MSGYNARRTVESLIFPYTFMLVVREGVPDSYGKERALVLADLQEAVRVTMPAVITTDERAQLERRTHWLIKHIIADPFRKNEMPVAKLGLTAFYMLQNLVDQDKFIVVEGGALSNALDAILPNLTDWTDKVRLDRSALKAARRTHEALQKEGYFQDVPWRKSA